MEQHDLENHIDRIIEQFADSPDLVESRAYGDGGADRIVWPRLKRAAVDQACSDPAAVSRYGIWANTVRDHIAEAIRLMRDGRPEQATELLVRAANSLSAFCELQTVFDEVLHE